MRKCHLIKLHAKFVVETYLLVQAFESPLINDVCTLAHRSCREACVIRLNDAWARFCRQLIIQSAACHAITFSGRVVPLAPNINVPSEVIPRLLAINNWKYEPRWHDATICIQAARDLKINNYFDVSAGIGLSPSPLEDLRRVRNFLAHRTKGTARQMEKVAKLLQLSPRTSVDDLLQTYVPPGLTTFSKWVSEMQLMSELSIQ